MPRCASCTRTPGSGCVNCARASRTSASRCCCAPPTPSATPAIRTTSCGSSCWRRRVRASTSSASSTPSTASRTWSSRYKPCSRRTRSANPPLLHRRPAGPLAPEVRPRLLPHDGTPVARHGRAHPGHQGTWRAWRAPYAAEMLVRELRQRSTSRSISTPTTRAHQCQHRPQGGRGRRGHRRCGRLAAQWRYQPAQPQLHGRRPGAHAARHRPRRERPQRRCPLLDSGARLLRPLRHRTALRQRGRLATRSRGANSPTCSSRRRGWGWAIAGRKSRRCTPGSTNCSATSSRSRRRAKWWATWRCSCSSAA